MCSILFIFLRTQKCHWSHITFHHLLTIWPRLGPRAGRFCFLVLVAWRHVVSRVLSISRSTVILHRVTDKILARSVDPPPHDNLPTIAANFQHQLSPRLWAVLIVVMWRSSPLMQMPCFISTRNYFTQIQAVCDTSFSFWTYLLDSTAQFMSP